MKFQHAYLLIQMMSNSMRYTFRASLVSMLALAISWATLAFAGPNEDLIVAAKRGDVAAVQALLDKGANINVKGQDAMTALMFASQAGKLEVVKALLANGADVNAKSEERKLEPRTALTLASQRGHLETVRLLSKENYIDAKTEFVNALNYASESGHFEIVKLLLDRVTAIKSVKIQDISRDALANASEAGHLEIVKLLLAKGAAVNADGQNVVPLIEASRTGHFEIVQLLLANGANVNAKDTSGMTALIGASGQIVWQVPSVMSSSRFGEQLKTCDFHLRKTLHGYLDIIKLLLVKGADINIKDNSGNTALTFAALTGQLDTTRLLLDNRADINTKTNDGETILMSMLQYGGNIDVMKLLLAKGININVRNKRNETALIFASRYACSKEIITLLKQADAKE